MILLVLMLLFRKQKNIDRRGENMKDFLEYIFCEVKNKRLAKTDAKDLIRQFQTNSKSCFLHPMLQQNTSDFSEQRFSSIFTGEEFFLTDHVVKGQRILPGVAYLEMARAAVEQAAGVGEERRVGIRFKNLVWTKPIAIGKQPMQIHIGIHPDDNGEIAYEIYSEPQKENTEPIIHSQGSAALCAVTEGLTLDLLSLRTQCNQGIFSSSQCYEVFRAVGLDYGPSHQGIEQIYVGQEQVLAKLTLPATVSDTKDQFILHPSLMDAALQASLMISASDVKLALPFALQELKIFEKCTSTMWALIRYSEGSKAKDKMKKIDIDLCDEQGRVCVRMKGLSSRVLEGKVDSVTDTEAIGTLMLQPSWQEKIVDSEATMPEYDRHLVMLCESHDISQEDIENQINGVRCLTLHAEQEGIESRFNNYAVQAFEQIKNILKDKHMGKVLVQIIVINQGEQQLFAGLSGLLKTAQLENPKLIGQLIEMEPGKKIEEIIEKLKENSRSPIDNHIRYQENKRCVASWNKVDVSKEAVKIPWKDQGVYLITGGAGGLGLIFAKEIAHKVKDATLILTGRTSLKKDKQAKLKELEELGAKIVYKQVDMTQKEAVVDLIESIRKDFKNLNGIIHSAGVIKDNFILKKTKEELQAVLAPKVTGLVNLDQASRELNLDFFVLFSSTTGAMGNPGQVDYATANAFMDVYAKFRHDLVNSGQRYGQTLSINWPLWQEGSMRVDTKTEKMMKENTGMIPMRTDVGIQALYQGLASGKSQVLVAEGNLKQLEVTLLEAQQFNKETPSHSEKNKAVPEIDQDWLKEKAENYFKKLLSTIIKLPAERIEIDAPMENYGIDSVMIMQLINQLEKVFGSLSKTLFFEYQNIKELTGYFLESHRDRLTELLGIEGKEVANAVSSEFITEVEDEKPAISRRKHSRFASMHIDAQLEKEKEAKDIAIIGLSGRYPGARTVQEFWQNLKNGKDCITEIPKDRWDYTLYFDENKDIPGKIYSKWGGFLEGVDQFDPLFFNISPREAEFMDPQERLFLQCVYETLEDAGYTREVLGSYRNFGLEGNVGVYVGVMYEEYQLYGAQEQSQGRPTALSGSPSSIANRISYFCNFHGPSMALDTMCSSSLTAIHLACQSLQKGGCELAIAGGVNVSVHPNKYLLLSQNKFVSSKGRCESFGQGGDGYVPGEGVGAVLLKPLSKAVADGDHIYGIIKATAINHGGKTNGYTVPNPNAQASVIDAALKEAGLNPRLISYVEAHGTGTSLGDPIEITGLTKAFQEYTKDKQYCAIGSAKSNIGHCESAAGIAALTKVLLQIKHCQLVPSLHSKTINTNIDFSSTPFIVQQELEEWKRPLIEINGQSQEYPRIAGISSFGAGGANAHVVIEEYIPDQARTLITVTQEKPAMIVLSAKSEECLKERSQQLLSAIQTQQFSDTDLVDIAYTLQVGREVMDERLAITAVSIRELEEKLQGYLDGKENIDDFYRGQVKRNKETLAVFTADEELQQAIGKWIQRGKYAKLLNLWVKGLFFDWNELYSGTKPQRISLPTYPFTKERYWVPEIETKRSSISAITAFGHPLLHQNTSDLAEQRFTSIFTGQEFFLADHLVKGHNVLPGVTHLEMARAAVQQAAGDLQEEKIQIQLQNIVWIRPVIVEEKPVKIHIGLYPEERGQIAYEIYSQPDQVNVDPIVYSQGIALLNTAQDAPVLELRDLQADCNQSVLSVSKLYETFKEMGIDYGPAQQGIEQLYTGQNQVLARLKLPTSITATQGQFVLHPSMMDAALQASIGLLMDTTLPNKPILPFALQELKIFEKCTSTMWALIRYSEGSKAKDKMKKIDIDLCDEQGRVCVRMKGLSSRVLEGKVDSVTDTEAIGTLMLQPSWQEKIVDSEATMPEYDRHLVMLCESHDISQEDIENQINGVRCLTLHAEQEGIESRFNNYAVQAFEQIKNILKDKHMGKVLVQIIVINQGEQQLFAGLSGLLKTAQLENPKLIGQLIEMEPGKKIEEIIEKLKENSRSPIDNHIRYQENKRCVASWNKVDVSKEAVKIPWKDQGVYLITGGAGGLGLIFAKEIAHKVKDATLILTGRTSLKKDKQAKLKELEELGAKIVYKQVDMTQKEAVVDLIESIRKDFKNLNGIIHSAGVIKDNFILKKTKEELQAVLAPKVTGLVNLDQASRELNLDFFVLFSSTTGAMGNPGQVDYATANAFMDVYAKFRHDLVNSGQRYGQTLSINWPLWQEGSMRVDTKTEKMMKENTGMIPMRTDVGIQALYQGLASGKSQVLVAEGNLKQLEVTLLEAQQFNKETPSHSEKNKAVPEIDQDWLKEKAENYFKKLLSTIIKLPAERIEIDAPMENYGIDSVMIMQLINQLEKVFGSLSKTLFFEYQNIKELTGYFLESHRDRLTELLGIEGKEVANAVSSEFITEVEDEKPAISRRKHSRFASMHIDAQLEKEKEAKDIAIIGLSGRYPGARTVQEFWQNLKNGKDCITEIPKDRWDYTLYFDENKDIPGKIYSKWGGFLEGVDQFDPLFFNISPREAEFMDPQERLFLQCVYETLEDAGYTREVLGSYRNFGLEGNVGVYVGVMYEEYQLYGAQEQSQGRPTALSGSPSSIANRISYFCNFHGPSMALDTMCSSSLTAIHLACQSLQKGGCELAIAGGVNVSVHPNKYLLLSQNKFVSSKGRCESFGQGGDGYVPGEGVGAVLLKPLSKAVADGDHIYGIIKATAINHGGKTNGYTVPNPNAQASVIDAALKEAGLNPRLISYVEAHGTGTSLGDPIEITGLTKAFQEYTKDKQYCAIGSAKSNIGHCESAAGIAALTKVLLQIKHCQLVPSLHSKTINTNIDFSSTPFIVQQELEEWKRPLIEINGQSQEYPRIAGISSFGAGGANAHVVIEEYIPDQARTLITVTQEKPAMIVLSAKSEECLKERSQQLLSAIQTQQFSDTDLVDIAYTLQVGREVMDERLAITAVSIRELEEKLQGYLDGKENIDDFYRGQVKRNKETLAVFTADEELQQAIGKWIQRGKYAKLLNLWVKGLSFDWNELYSGTKPQRISLPTYPFTKERYWVPEIKDASNRNLAQIESSHSEKTEKFILTKEWCEKNIDAKEDVHAGLIVVLGTSATTDLAQVLFEATETTQVVSVIHGETHSPEEISTDFYSSSAGESLYQQIKDIQNGNKLLGVIDITAYDGAYEQSTTVESGKITFLQKMIENDRSEGYRLLQVTHKLHAFQLAKTTLQGARMAGLYRMLGAEYKQIQTITMDSDCLIQDHETLVKQIQAEFLYTDKENFTEFCYRNNQRYQPYLNLAQTNDEIQEKLQMPASYGENDVILITGGAQGIGASIAKHLVSHGAKNLVIMGREALPEPSEWSNILINKEKTGMEEKIKRLQFLIDRGAKVRYYSIPLTDEKGIKAIAQNIRHDLGPITGVFHCAGLVSKNPAFFKKQLQDFVAVCEPKMKGLVALHRALVEEPLKFFILFSSISSIVPTLATGQSDYAAANAYMDYYALNQAGEGKHYFKSIQWPAWGETGMATRGMRTPAYVETGLVSLTTNDGLAFLEIIMKTTPYIVSLPCVVVPSEFTSKYLLKSLQGEKESRQASRRKIEMMPEASVDLRMLIIQWLKQVFSTELKLKLAQLDNDKPFYEYGVESIMLVQLTQILSEGVGQTLDPALLLQHSTISALADYFMANNAENLQKTFKLETIMATEFSPTDGSCSINNTLSPSLNAASQSSSKSISIRQPIGTNQLEKLVEDIAVVGLSCRFPDSPTKEKYWDLLTKGVTAIRSVPKQRWIPRENRQDYGGWIEDVELFDPNFFNINEQDAAIMDPQARIILEESLRAIYDAGYEHKQLSGQKIGVYIGGRSQPNMNLNAVLKAPNPILGMGQNYLATNISRCFNFKGPSLVVDTACSSGITGMMFACDSLREGRIDMGLVGAVNVLVSPYAHDLFAARNILSKSGEFHIFDQRSDGEVLGEGAGVVLLKRLRDAVKDGNHIYGVIKAIAENNDGQTLGPGSPNMNAQKQVMQDALTLSGKQPTDIGYIEINGGGSPVVDSIEIKALSDVYNLGNQALSSCVIGSVKPNIGHLLLTSGLAGFIRCVLSVYHKQIPPFLSALDPFNYYDFSSSRIEFNRKTIDWRVDPGKKRLAAQNSFPDGGTNCHLLIEEFVPDGIYQQQYFSRKIPKMTKKRFPLPQSSLMEPSLIIAESSEKQTDKKRKQHNCGAIPSLWGEIS